MLGAASSGGAARDAQTGDAEGGGHPAPLCTRDGPAHVYMQPSPPHPLPPGPHAQVPVCTPALYIQMAGDCVGEQTGVGNGCFGVLGCWTPSLERYP